MDPPAIDARYNESTTFIINKAIQNIREELVRNVNEEYIKGEELAPKLGTASNIIEKVTDTYFSDLIMLVTNLDYGRCKLDFYCTVSKSFWQKPIKKLNVVMFSTEGESYFKGLWKSYDEALLPPGTTFWDKFNEEWSRLTTVEGQDNISNQYPRYQINWLLLKLPSFELKDDQTFGEESAIKAQISEYEQHEIAQRAAETCFNHNNCVTGRVVWVTVAPTQIPSNNGTIDEIISDFKYLSKDPSKTVYIPYHDIMKSVIDANWTLLTVDTTRGTGGNYLTAHLVFVISDGPHEKKLERKYEGKYKGGRTFLDFPLALPLDLMTQQRIFANQEAYEQFLSNSGSLVGKSDGSYRSYAHSEWKLEEILKDPDSISKIAEILKVKLIGKFGICTNFKVYQLILFTNSNRNICDQCTHHEFGCEGILWNLQSSTAPGSFLYMLSQQLSDRQFILSEKRRFPSMLIVNSSYESFYCKNTSGYTLYRDANLWLSGKDMSEEKCCGVTVDTKALAGKVILSSPEWAVDGIITDLRVTMKEYSNPPAIPFYTALASATGAIKKAKINVVATPKCFDKVDIIHIIVPRSDPDETVPPTVEAMNKLRVTNTEETKG